MASSVREKKKKFILRDRWTLEDQARWQHHAELTKLMPKLDQAEMQVTRKWGKGKLLTLVSEATQVKFNTVLDRLVAAIEREDYGAAVKDVPILTRAWQALDKEAEALGHKPVMPAIVELEVNGECYQVVVHSIEECQLEQADQVRAISLEGLIRIDQAARRGDFSHKAVEQVVADRVDGGPVDPNCEIPF